jgi:glycosyltransferase involved in cell wall biosynthesis
VPSRLLLVAPLLGGRPGQVPDVFERLGPLLADDGHEVQLTSARTGRLRRSADMALTTLRTRRSTDVVVIHLYTGRSFAVEALVVALSGARPAIGVLAGGGLPALEDRHPRLVRRVLGRFDALVAPSEYLARWAQEVVDLTVKVIANPLDPDDYPFRLRDPARPTILWMRAYHPIYAPEVAVQAVERLRHELPEVRLTMVGADKGLRPDVERQVRAAGLEEHVEVRGFAGPAEKRALLESHDVFLNTSLVDNRPVSVVEAGAAGLCIVSSEVGGVADLLVDGVSGLLVAPEDSAAVAQGIQRIVGDSTLAAQLSAGGREVAEAGRPEVVAGAWTELLTAVRSPGAPPSR